MLGGKKLGLVVKLATVFARCLPEVSARSTVPWRGRLPDPVPVFVIFERC